MQFLWGAVILLALGLAGAWYGTAGAVEQAAVTIEVRDGAFEVRRYAPVVAAEVTRPGDRRQGVSAAFGPLADYIFAKDRGGDKIAMTAPVTQQAEAGGWQVRFLMPAARGMATLPPPGGDVRLVELPARRMAAVRFSGRWTDARFDAAEARLRGWMDARGLTPAGPATYGYYNPPFLPWFLRRNEVMIEIAE